MQFPQVMYGAYEGKRLFPERAHIVAIPFLTLLAEIDGFEKVGAWMADKAVLDGPKIRNGNTLDGRLAQKEIADRRVRGLSEVFQLLKRWPRLFALPIGKLRKPMRQ